MNANAINMIIALAALAMIGSAFAQIAYSTQHYNYAIDAGETDNIMLNISGGAAPYNVIWHAESPNGHAFNIAANIVHESTSLAFNVISANSIAIYAYNGSISYQGSVSNVIYSSNILGNWSFNALITDSTANSVSSNTFYININPALSSSISPSGISLDYGSNAIFNGVASGGTPPYSYSWSLNGNAVSSDQILIMYGNSTTVGKENLTLTVSDNATTPSINKTSIIVNINPPECPIPLISSTSNSIGMGLNLTFGLVIKNCTPSGYSWIFNGIKIGDSNSLTLYGNSTTMGYHKIYAVVNYSDPKTTEVSNILHIGVYPRITPPEVTTETLSYNATTFSTELVPSNLQISENNLQPTMLDFGQPVEAIEYNGSGDYSYKWYLNGNLIGKSQSINPNQTSNDCSLSANAVALQVNVTDANTSAIPQSNTLATYIVACPPLTEMQTYVAPEINLSKSGESFSFNALKYINVTGGTGNYIYTWGVGDFENTSLIPANTFLLSKSCISGGQLCNITAENPNVDISGMLTLTVNDTSAGNQTTPPTQYFFITDPPPLMHDYLYRPLEHLNSAGLRIGIIIPSIGQIIYSLGLGDRVSVMTPLTLGTLNAFGVQVAKSVNSSVCNYCFSLNQFASPFILSGVNYVPVDAGDFASTLISGLAAFRQANISAPVLAQGYDTNVSGVEKDIAIVANSTGYTGEGSDVINFMQGIVSRTEDKLSSASVTPSVAFIIYAPAPVYADGNESFVGSELHYAGGTDIFKGFYPTPSAGDLLNGNPDYIIASLFYQPGNISDTYSALYSIPGIKNTTAYKEGHIYVLGNLATNLTNEPGPMVVFGIKLLAMILHPETFGFTNSSIPNNITSAWVEENVKPSFYIAPQPASPPSPSPSNGSSGSPGSQQNNQSGQSSRVSEINVTRFDFNKESGFDIRNFSQGITTNVSVNGNTLGITASYIYSNSAIITINGTSYSILLGAPLLLKNGDYINITDINPTLHTLTINIYAIANTLENTPQANASIWANYPNGETRVLITAGKSIMLNFTGLKLYISTNSPIVSNATIYVKNASVETLPTNTKAIKVLNITVLSSANVIVRVRMNYSPSLDASLIFPYDILNGSWIKINMFSINESSHTISFQIPADPVVGLFEETPAPISTNTVQPTKNISAYLPQPSPPKSNIPSSTIIIGFVGIAVALATSWMIRRKKPRKAQLKARNKNG